MYQDITAKGVAWGKAPKLGEHLIAGEILWIQLSEITICYWEEFDAVPVQFHIRMSWQQSLGLGTPPRSHLLLLLSRSGKVPW